MTQIARSAIAVSVVAAALVTAAGLVSAQGPRQGRAVLDGYQEVPAALSTSGHGTMRISISPDNSFVSYELTYAALEAPVLQAHIHLGRPAVNGGVMVFLCANAPLGPPPTAPATPACPLMAGTVSGVLTAADVIGPADQGVSAGDFQRFLAALRAEAGYVNVHTTKYPGGEIRGQVTFRAHEAAIR